MFWPLHCPSSIHKGYGFGVVVSPQPGRPDVTVFGRLADSRLISSGGEGQGVANVQASRNCSQPREIVVSPITDGSLLGDGSGQPVFEGFSDSQADRNCPRADHRTSVLQAAKRGLLARFLGSPDVVVPCGSGGSSPSSISTVMSSRVLGFCRRVGLGRVDRHDSFRSAVVVGHLEHSSRGVSHYPSYGPSLLVRRVRPGLGRPCRRPICFRPVVSGRDRNGHQPSGVAGYSSQPSTFPMSTGGVVGRGVCRQHHSACICTETGRNSLTSPERGGSALTPVGRETTDSASPSVCDGHPQRGGRLSLTAQRGHRVRVDSGSGGGRSSGLSLASDHRSFCDGVKPSVAGVLCSDGGPSVGGNGRSSSMLEPFSSLCLPSVPPCSPGSQVSGVGELRVDSSGSVVASTGMVSRSSASSAVPSGTLANSSGPSSATPFSSLPSQSGVAGSSSVETVRRFAREWGVSGAVARQLANCHWPSLQRLYQHRWLAYRR